MLGNQPPASPLPAGHVLAQPAPLFAPHLTSQPDVRCRWPAPWALASMPWPPCSIRWRPLPHAFTRPGPHTLRNTLVLLQNTFSVPRLSYLDGCPIVHIFRMPSVYAFLTSYHVGFKLSIDVGAVTAPSSERPSSRSHFASIKPTACTGPRTQWALDKH